MLEIFDISFWEAFYKQALGALLLGYIFGSIPFGLIIGKVAGIGDIRQSGSGNIGATNMLRLGGKKLGVMVLLCDIFKGALPVVIVSLMISSPNFKMLAGFGALIGHLFPIWLKFNGGKGVATTLGVFLGFNPIVGGLVCLTWLVSAIISKISSLSALMAVSVAPVIGVYFIDKEFGLFAIIIALLVWAKHHENAVRLFKGTEPKIGKKK